MPAKVTETFYPESQQHWRQWLEKNHLQKDSIWLIVYKQNAGKPTITWSESVDVALCFGWIDSIKRKLDDERSIQFFSKRKATSTWSKINKLKVAKFIEAGLMTKYGLACVKLAKENGSWVIIDSVEELIIPIDLKTELNAKPLAMDFFLSLSKSVRKAMLQWVILAKRPETRLNRIKEIAKHAEKGIKPKQF